jgi:hypothetical protein
MDDWKTPLGGTNRTQAGSLCYTNAIVSRFRVHGDSSGLQNKAAWFRAPGVRTFVGGPSENLPQRG